MLGKKLKRLRIEKGLSQVQLAQKIGKKPSSVGMYEREQREPSHSALLKLAEFFEVSIDYLLGKTPFGSDVEAFHSIVIASLKYVHENLSTMPNWFNYHIPDIIYDKFHDETEKNEKYLDYCELLERKFEKDFNNMTPLQLFEYAHLIFEQILYAKNFQGNVTLINYDGGRFAIEIGTHKIEPIIVDTKDSIILNPYVSTVEQVKNQAHNLEVFKTSLPTSSYATVVGSPPEDVAMGAYTISDMDGLIRAEDIGNLINNPGTNIIIEVHNDSMWPQIQPGDRVHIRIRSDVKNGKVALVQIEDGDATLQRIVISDNGIMLVPINPAYQPEFFSTQDIESKQIKVIGQATSLRRRL